MNSSHCAVCSKLIFTFERKVKISDLSSDELTACGTLNPNADFQKLLVLNEAVLCASCYRRVQGMCDSVPDESVIVLHKGEDFRHSVSNETLREEYPDEGTSIDPPHYSKKDAVRRRQTAAPTDHKVPKDEGKTTPEKDASKDKSKDTQRKPEDTDDELKGAGRIAAYTVPAAVLGGLAAVVAAPVAIAAAGFGAGGIIAGSVAASLMSSATTTGVGLGVVAALQSIGAAGLGVAGAAAVGTAGSAVGAGIGGLVAKLTETEEEGEAGSKPKGNGTKPTGDGGYLPPFSTVGSDSTKPGSHNKHRGKVDRHGNKRSGDTSGRVGDNPSWCDGGDPRAARNEQNARLTTSQQEITVAAASAISSGTSLAGTSTHTLMQDGYRVTVGIEVENWTRFHLSRPHVQLKGGALSMAPSLIVPAAREVMIARKTSGTATGSCGTVSWLIQDVGRRLVIMWSAPFNFNHHSNWVGVGITAPGNIDHPADDSWFDQMYYADSSEELSFERREYYADVRPVVFRDIDFELEVIMSSDHKALIKVIFRPVNMDNLAPNINEQMLTK
ncbi:hypothetical protein V1264_020589 [Littorina saxatilis]|uniref:Uncharacterized protein n=3 Tax=Littorina saxatilis TaxID=31220 RepID=A0AAN9BBX6_9CAEN